MLLIYSRSNVLEYLIKSTESSVSEAVPQVVRDREVKVLYLRDYKGLPIGSEKEVEYTLSGNQSTLSY